MYDVDEDELLRFVSLTLGSVRTGDWRLLQDNSCTNTVSLVVGGFSFTHLLRVCVFNRKQ